MRSQETVEDVVRQAYRAFRRGRRKEREVNLDIQKETSANVGADCKAEGTVRGTSGSGGCSHTGCTQEGALREFRKALELCDKALAWNSGIGDLHLTRAACFLHLDDLAGAAKAYERALAEPSLFQSTAA